MSEIAYSINSQATLNQGCLVLDLLEAFKENHTYSLNPNKNLSVPQWRALALQSVDKEAFAFLLKEEILFQQRATSKTPHTDSLILRQLHISPSQVLAAFQLLAPTQKLFCQGKQLILDFYGKTEFYYEGIPLKNGQLEIVGHVRWRDTDISLNDCEAIGPGKPHHWFVRGLVLKMIHTSIPWKKLQELKQGPLLLEGGKKQAFLDDLDAEDAESPQFIVKEGSLEEAKQSSSPFPLLLLKDRWGACADLWMDYGQGHLVAFHDSHPVVKDEKGRILFKRQPEVETNWEKDLLETDFIKKLISSSHYYCPLDRIGKSLTFLLEVGWNIQDWQHRRVIKQTDLHLELEDKTRIIAVKGHLNYENYQADVAQVLGAFNRREHFIQLSSNTVGLLSLDASQQALKDLAEEGEWTTGEVHIHKNRFGTIDPLLKFARISPTLESLKEKWQNFQGIQEALPSTNFKGQLRPYQQQGVNWLAFLHEYGFHGILADEMGLGKTVQILAFLSRLHQGPHLIVMPTSLLFNWRNEIRQFLPHWKCTIHQGPQRAKNGAELQNFDIILTSYTTLRLDLPLFQSLAYVCLILDEAQMIKNAHTQTAQAVCQLNAQLRLSLTGTPVENHLPELWSHFHFLMPDLFGTQEQFEADIQSAQSDRRYLERIKRKVAPFLLRRRKQEVAADLPERLDQVVWVQMPEEQRAVYDQLLAGFKSGLLKKVELEGSGKYRLEILEAILRLRQVCCHPLLVTSLLEENVPASAKFDALLQDLETIVDEGHKVLIYSQFTSMLHLMVKAAKEKRWNYGYLDGSTKNREEVVTQFQEDPSQLLFFISLKAGGVGLNLTAADYVYIYDPWWNEAVEEQAIQRAHRIGRKETVIAKRFVVAESIEEKMMKLKAAKRMVIDDLFDTETIAAHLTLDDLQDLLS